MQRIEVKFRGVAGYFGDAERKTFGELIRSWDDYDGERAVNAWIFQSGGRADIALLHDTYEGFRAARQTRDDKPAFDFSRKGYERQAAGVTPYELMREGFLSKWSQLHPGQPIPDEWDRMFRKLNEKRYATDDPFA